jgi:hypothetical protein
MTSTPGRGGPQLTMGFDRVTHALGFTAWLSAGDMCSGLKAESWPQGLKLNENIAGSGLPYSNLSA